MGEAFGCGVAAGFFLEIVVADFLSSIDSFFDIAFLERGEEAVLVVAPYASVVVGLEFDADGGLVFSGFVLAGHLGVRLVERAEEVLHVVAYFVGDNVGACEVAAGSDGGRHFVEEVKVEVDLFVGRAVEGACT